MNTLARNTLMALAVAVGVSACGSTTELDTASDTASDGVAESKATDSTDAPEVEEAGDVPVEPLEIVVPADWDVSIEAMPADTPEPEPTPTDVVCPNGSTPRPPFPAPVEVGSTQLPDGGFVVYVLHEYDTADDAVAPLDLIGEGKCEVVVEFFPDDPDSEDIEKVFIDSAVQLDVPPDLGSSSVTMGPEDGSEIIGLTQIARGNRVVLISVTGMADPVPAMQAALAGYDG